MCGMVVMDFISESQMAEFDAWVAIMHANTETMLDDENTLEALGAGGYWKVMAVAAWAEKHRPEFVEQLVTREYLACLWRETEPAAQEVSGS